MTSRKRLYSAPAGINPQAWGRGEPPWTAALAAAAISGAMLGASFPSLSWGWMAWFALVPLWIVVARARGLWRALWPGYLAGVVFFAVSCPWIVTTIHNYGDLTWPLAAFIFILFLALMGSYLALFALAGYWIGSRLGHRLLPLPFLWIAVEWLRTYTPMGGFPWNLLGYSQVQNLGFMRVAAVAGVYGAGWLIAAVNTVLALLVLRFHPAIWPRLWRRQANRQTSTPGFSLSTAAAVLGGLAILAFAALPFHPSAPARAGLRARLVQPNTPLDQAWTSASLAQFLQAQLRLSVPAGRPPVQLIIWPEQPAPLNYALEPVFQATVRQMQAGTNVAFLFGEVSYPWTAQGTPDYTQPRNSSLLIRPGGSLGPRYDKLHLVPFGEYVPLPKWLKHFAGVGKLVQDVGDFVPGTQIQLFPLAGHRFATMICYESIFPAIARREVAAGAEWLVNQSDDSWYGTSSAAAQGLTMARVRAIENHRWLLRDTDDGLTAVIDPYGRITAELPRFTAASLDAGLIPLTGLTFYTRHGDWLAEWCAVIIGVLALWSWLWPRRALRLRQRSPAPECPPE